MIAIHNDVILSRREKSNFSSARKHRWRRLRSGRTWRYNTLSRGFLIIAIGCIMPVNEIRKQSYR